MSTPVTDVQNKEPNPLYAPVQEIEMGILGSHEVTKFPTYHDDPTDTRQSSITLDEEIAYFKERNGRIGLFQPMAHRIHNWMASGLAPRLDESILDKKKQTPFQERHQAVSYGVAKVASFVSFLYDVVTLSPALVAIGGSQASIMQSAKDVYTSLHKNIGGKSGAVFGGLVAGFVVLLREIAWILGRITLIGKMALDTVLGLLAKGSSLIVAAVAHLCAMNKRFAIGLGISVGIAGVLGGIATALILTGAIAFFTTPAGWAVLGAVGGATAVGLLTWGIIAGIKNALASLRKDLQRDNFAVQMKRDQEQHLEYSNAALQSRYNTEGVRASYEDGVDSVETLDERFLGKKNALPASRAEAILIAESYQPSGVTNEDEITAVRDIHLLRILLEMREGTRRDDPLVCALAHTPQGPDAQPHAFTDQELVKLYDDIMASSEETSTLKQLLLALPKTKEDEKVNIQALYHQRDISQAKNDKAFQAYLKEHGLDKGTSDEDLLRLYSIYISDATKKDKASITPTAPVAAAVGTVASDEAEEDEDDETSRVASLHDMHILPQRERATGALNLSRPLQIRRQSSSRASEL